MHCFLQKDEIKKGFDNFETILLKSIRLTDIYGLFKSSK